MEHFDMSGLKICLAFMDLETVCYKIFLARQCVISKTQIHISKVNVTKFGQRSKGNSLCPGKIPSCMDGF